jgi:hypothetical protein
VPVVTQMGGQRGVDAHEALDPMHHAGPQPQRDRRFSSIHKFLVNHEDVELKDHGGR